MSDDLEKTQEIPVSNVYPFTGVAYRITAESVIRNLLSQIDQVESIVVVFRLKDQPTLRMNYSSEINGMDVAVGALAITSLAEKLIGFSPDKRTDS